jgi:hypothetical protein
LLSFRVVSTSGLRTNFLFAQTLCFIRGNVELNFLDSVEAVNLLQLVCHRLRVFQDGLLGGDI